MASMELTVRTWAYFPTFRLANDSDVFLLQLTGSTRTIASRRQPMSTCFVSCGRS